MEWQVVTTGSCYLMCWERSIHKEASSQNFLNVLRTISIKLFSFAILCVYFVNLQTLFWGVPRHHQGVLCIAQVKTPPLVALLGQAGFGFLWSLLPLLGTALFGVTSSPTPHTSPALNVCVLTNQPIGLCSPSVRLWLWGLVHVQYLCLSRKGQGSCSDSLPRGHLAPPGPTRPHPCSTAPDSVFWCWEIFVQSVKLMRRLYLANKLVFKIIVTALDVGVHDKIKDRVDCR